MKNEITTVQLLPGIQSLAVTIRNEIEAGKERAYLAMQQEKRLTYWNVGKHIKEHLLQNEGREDYASYVISQLSNELNLASTILYESVHFYEQYPKIVNLNSQLTWSHIRVLTHMPEKQSRQAFEKKIIAEKLSVHELKKLVKSDKKSAKNSQDPILKTSRDKPYIYRLKKIQKQTLIDLGFRIYIESPFTDAEKPVPKDSVVHVEKMDDKYQCVNLGKGSVPHYTYKAYVLEVLDGDTLWVNIDLGFNAWTTQKIRLKGINTKELQNQQGQNAKEFIEAKLKGCKFIAIKTYWRDKFTRYLADIYYKKRETDFYNLIENGKFLNQELLDEKLAVKY